LFTSRLISAFSAGIVVAFVLAFDATALAQSLVAHTVTVDGAPSSRMSDALERQEDAIVLCFRDVQGRRARAGTVTIMGSCNRGQCAAMAWRNETGSSQLGQCVMEAVQGAAIASRARGVFEATVGLHVEVDEPRLVDEPVVADVVDPDAPVGGRDLEVLGEVTGEAETGLGVAHASDLVADGLNAALGEVALVRETGMGDGAWVAPTPDLVSIGKSTAIAAAASAAHDVTQRYDLATTAYAVRRSARAVDAAAALSSTRLQPAIARTLCRWAVLRAAQDASLAALPASAWKPQAELQ